MNLHEVTAHQQIREALTRYCYGLDRADPELITGVFHPDGIDAHGEGREGTAQQLADDSNPRKRAALPNIGQHIITNHSIVVRGSRAWCESYWFMVDPHPEGHALGGGRYLDRFELRDGQWRIAHRTVVVDWSRDVEAFAPLDAVGSVTRGGLGQDDPSAGFFVSCGA